jgi:hypothetical protein
MKFYTERIDSLKQFVRNEILHILQEKFTLIEKQKKLENFLFKNLKNFIYVSENNVYYEKIITLKNTLNNINFLNLVGKTYFKKFFKIINENELKQILLEEFLIYINYYKNSSGNFLLYSLISIFNDHLSISQAENNKILIYKTSAYIIENLKIHNIIYYDKVIHTYKLFDINFEILDVNVIKNIHWPLLVQPNNFKMNTKTYQIMGGYYIYPLNIVKEKNITQKIEIKNKFLNLINEYQKLSFKLLDNKNSLKVLKKYYLYLENLIEQKEKDLKTNFLENKFIKYGIYKHYYYFDTLIQDWYVLYQFFILKQSKVENIYFTYQIDFRGRIYNSVNYGLNCTFNKLSRILITQGLYEIKEENKEDLKKYIFKILEIKTEEEFNNYLIYVKDLILNNFEKEINFEKIKGIILLCDWIDNVCINNTTEILIELDASQSGFQMLSMFANDFKALVHTNLISTNEKYDLYSLILQKFYEELVGLNKNWIKIVDRSFIKKIIMTIPYGSTYVGQINMLLEEFRSRYDLNYLFSNEKDVNILIESNIILENDNLQNSLKTFISNLENKSIKEVPDFGNQINTFQKEIENNVQKYFFKIIINLLQKILKEEYKDLMNFIEKIKILVIKRIDFVNNNLNLNSFETEYLNYYLSYYKYEKLITEIGNVQYERFVINTNKIDYKQSRQGFIANLCHGLGDSFIIHKLIEKLLENKDLTFFTIHDSILIKVTSINDLQKNINYSYNFIYGYIFEKKYFLDFIDVKEKYNLNSLIIFKI